MECATIGHYLPEIPVRDDDRNEVGELDTVSVGDVNKNKTVQKTYEDTFMEQVQTLGDERQRRAPSKFIEELNVAKECEIVDSLTSEVDEPKSMKDAMNSENSDQWK